MADVLARIVARKRIEVAERLAGRVTDAMPTTRSLAAVLARPGARFIMEVKRASPSGHRSAVTVAQAAAAYAPVADAISVLVDGPDFGGSLDDVRAVRQLFDGPILAKEFYVDPAQVSEARAAGADAVLVMMSVLDDAGAGAMLAEARRLAMDAVVEVHDEAELQRALALGATIIGINNRDLKTLTTDLAVTERLAALVPADVLLVSESGVASRADVERLAPNVDAFLVGSALMASPDIIDAARTLVFGRVKLCGLTRVEDVALAAKAGATYAGLIMVPGTPRAVTLAEAGPLADEARRQGIKPVGVFRNASADTVIEAVETLGLRAVQLHDEAALDTLRQRLPQGVELWGVNAIGETVAERRAGCDRTLFDTARGGQSGGTGTAFDWSRIAGRDDLPEAFLAGGIGPANARAASRVGAYGLDVGSGVERSPGIKDRGKVEALFGALRVPVRGDVG